MRISILMSGLMYSYKHSYQTILDNVINTNLNGGENIIDIFIYTTTKNKIKGGNKELTIAELEKNEIKQIFSPFLKDIIFSEEDVTYLPEFEKFAKKYTNTIKNFTYDAKNCWYYGIEHVRQVDQYYRLHKAFKMAVNYQIQHNIKYDLMVRLRPDDYIERPLIFTIPKPNTLYTLGPSHGIDGLIKQNFVCEHFFYGNYETFNNFCLNFVESYGNFREKVIIGNADATLSPESQFTQWAKANGVFLIHCGYDYFLKHAETDKYLNITNKISFYALDKVK